MKSHKKYGRWNEQKIARKPEEGQKVPSLPPKHLHWTGTDRNIGDAIYKAMTTEDV